MDTATIRRLHLWFGRIMRSLLIVATLAGAAIFVFQDVLLWHPRPYAPGEVESFPRPLTTLAFTTVQGHQTAFYATPRDHRPSPSALWVLFAGNGSLALDWREFVASDADPGRAFLFVDYPGYGRCQGKPSPTSIAQNVDGAMDVLARRLGQPNGPAFERSLGVHSQLATMAHSMGTGVALEFAARTPSVSRIVLVAPFTSLRAMAQRTVGWPLCWLMRGNFDNRAPLDDVGTRATPPPVLVLHGERDSLIPPAMGRALATEHPGFVRYEAIAGADHGDVVAIARTRLLAVLDER